MAISTSGAIGKLRNTAATLRGMQTLKNGAALAEAADAIENVVAVLQRREETAEKSDMPAFPTFRISLRSGPALLMVGRITVDVVDGGASGARRLLTSMEAQCNGELEQRMRLWVEEITDPAERRDAPPPGGTAPTAPAFPLDPGYWDRISGAKGDDRDQT